MARMTAPNRFSVRLALVTGTTLATVIGAQTLATLDASAFSQNEIPAQVEPTNFVASPVNNDLFINTPQQNVDTNGTISNKAPNIVIIRHAGDRSASVPSAPTRNTGGSAVNSAPSFQPPSPVMSAPAPTIIQSVSAGSPVSRSSR